MKSLPLNALRALAAVKLKGGVRPAARELGVSHSAVSRHLRELEAWLGAPLFEKGGARTLNFTGQGEMLAKAAASNLQSLQRATERVREITSPNTVSIACAPSVAARWLLPRLADFEATHASITISVIANAGLGSLADQNADLGIRMGQGPWRGLESEPLMDDALFPVVQARSWEDAGRPDGEACLTKWPLLHDRDPSASWASWFELCPVEGAAVAAGPRFTSSDLVLRAALQGLGIALARARLAEDDLLNGLLARPFGEVEVNLNDAYWIVREGRRPMRQVERMVVDWLKLKAGPTLQPPNGLPPQRRA